MNIPSSRSAFPSRGPSYSILIPLGGEESLQRLLNTFLDGSTQFPNATLQGEKRGLRKEEGNRNGFHIGLRPVKPGGGKALLSLD